MRVWSRSGLAGVVVLALAVVQGLGAAASRAAEPTPVRIAFVGDSMADGLWGAMYRRLGKDKCLAEKVKTLRKAKNGTGLARLDQFNWVAEVGAMAKDDAADLFVGSFGVNDRQAIVDASRVRTEYDAPDFDLRYQSFAEALIRNAVSGGASILVVGLPVMLDPDANADAKGKNALFAAATAAVASPLAAYVKPWSSQAGDDEYKPYIANANNQLVQFRAADGVHFTQYGYDRLMDYFYPFIMASLKQRGRDLAGECAK